MNSLISDAETASLRCNNEDPVPTLGNLGPALSPIPEDGEGLLLPPSPVYCFPGAWGTPEWSPSQSTQQGLCTQRISAGLTGNP